MVAPAVRTRVWLSRTLTRLGFPRDWFLIPLAAVVGTLAGLAAFAFDHLVEWSTEHLFGLIHGVHASWQMWAGVVLIPAAGGLAVGIIRHFARHSLYGHGVPAVMEALAQRQGRMRGRVGVLRAVTASLTIGSGGSAGVEGPIIQIGSVVASVTGQALRLGRRHLQTLVGCGAAGGLAGIFNAPIAGVLFVMEVLLRDFSTRTFMPIVVAGVFGTVTAQATLGNEALFAVPPAIREHSFTLSEMGFYAILGVLCGAVGAGFTRSLVLCEAGWRRLPLHPAGKPAVGGLLLGLFGLAFFLVFGLDVIAGHRVPAFFGNGYPVVEALFHPATYDASAAGGDLGVERLTLGFLIATLLLKVVGTSLTLGSGGSGGVFAPSLFMGAALGAAFGTALDATGWLPWMTPATYALVGMAGVLSGAVHCPMTAFILMFELTRDYKVILPAMLVAVIAMVVAQMFFRDSIYSLALRERGIHTNQLSDMMVLRRIEAADVPLAPAVTVHAEEPAQRLVELAESHSAHDYVVVDESGRYAGLVVGDDMRTTLLQQEAIPLMIVKELMRRDVPAVAPDERLDQILDKFSEHDVDSLVVADEEGEIRGLVTRARLMRAYHDAIDQRAG